jgi:hypothetical protein
MDLWRADVNTQRPHEALGLRCPASVYQPSARPCSDLLSGWDYTSDHHKRRVNQDGYMKWQDHRLYLSAALRGEDVALSHRDDGEWMSRFRSFGLRSLRMKVDFYAVTQVAGLKRYQRRRLHKAAP